MAPDLQVTSLKLSLFVGTAALVSPTSHAGTSWAATALISFADPFLLEMTTIGAGTSSEVTESAFSSKLVDNGPANSSSNVSKNLDRLSSSVWQYCTAGST
ncbi:hypothetical protein PR003_g5175 [Phytophthora rubi]|uniref:Secreted protein n=1 Tax=Phytophthora rubi TaxID=129364 RepID=A0A6A3NHR1_9STRA|nr:hypothetical protein PR002_g5232 [Phytophthora rubi]KAE9045306.1 hypothetical protein PR001_g5025 [Phytophthora rubi]KAE9350832.1 hypothetical protein PR003_g5175 [Phytophthora rubi]